MTTEDPQGGAARISATAAALRISFDEGFAAAPAASRSERLEDVLAIRVGGDPYALRLSEIAGLHCDLKIVPVPSSITQLLGIAGLRGMMAPVYDLAALLRYPPAARPSWLVIAGGAQPVGFAFETFEAHLRVSEESSENGEAQGGGATRRQTRGTVRAAGALRPIIHMASVMEMIRDNNS
jgi:purine-binding chemotaxis protein CheW